MHGRMKRSGILLRASGISARGLANSAASDPLSCQNPAAVLHKANDLRFENHALPAEIPLGYVRVGIRALGICASDLHYLHEVILRPLQAPSCTLCPQALNHPQILQGRIGKAVVDRPMVIGHETAG